MLILALAGGQRAGGVTRHDELRALYFSAASGLEGRLYGPFPPPPTERSAFRGDLFRRLTALPDSRDAATLRRAAAAELLASRREVARALLEESLAKESVAAGWNDLAVVHLSDAAAGVSARVAALDAAITASQLDPFSAAAFYNQGLAAQRLSLPDGARAAWKSALGLETDPGWRIHIAARLASLPAAASSARGSDPPTSREWAFETGLTDWVSGSRPFDRDATASRLRALAATLAREGDSLLADCVNAIERHPGLTTPALPRGHLAFKEGKALLRKGQPEAAVPALETAVESLRAAGSPCWLLARAELGLAIYQTAGPSAAVRYHESTLRGLGDRYPSLSSRLNWLYALALKDISRLDEAIVAYDRAVDGYARTNEDVSRCAASRASADLLRSVGYLEGAWHRLEAAMTCLPEESDAFRRYLTYFEASLLASAGGFQRAALTFQDAAVTAATSRGVPSSIAEAHIRRARLRTQLGLADDAQRDLDTARGLVDRIEVQSAALRDYVDHWTKRVTAELELTRTPARAVASLDESAIEYFSRHEPSELVGVYLTAGRAHQRLGNRSAARGVWSRALDRIAQDLLALRTDEHQASYVDATWDVSAELVRDRWLAGEHEAAFDLAQRSRGISSPGRRAETHSASQIRGMLAERDLLVSYVVLNDRVLAWALSRDSLESWSLPLSAERLGLAVSAFNGIVASATDQAIVTAAGSHLSRALFQGLHLGRYSRISVIADGPLHLLAFAALPSVDSRYLVETHELSFATISPSGAIVPAKRVTPRVVVIEGQPETGRNALVLSGREASDVERHYRGATRLDHHDASASRVRDAIESADIVHFTGHAESNTVVPWKSHLLIAPDASHPQGRLTADEIGRWSLGSLELVVLSACSTFVGRHYRGEGLVSLARPFIRAGAGEVVGSLWDVEDRSTSRLLAAFHQRYAVSRDAAASLRSAQLALRNSRDPTDRAPRSWAGFASTRVLR